VQLTEREAVEVQTQLLAFDRQNHMGASDSLAKSLKKAIKEEAEAMLTEKKVVSSAVNIQENAHKMKVLLTDSPCPSCYAQACPLIKLIRAVIHNPRVVIVAIACICAMAACVAMCMPPQGPFARESRHEMHAMKAEGRLQRASWTFIR